MDLSPLVITKFAIEIIAIAFLTYTFFDLMYVDSRIKKSQIAERFEIFHRYKIFRSALIYIVVALYFFLLSRIAFYFTDNMVFQDSLVIIGDLFVIVFTLNMFRMVRHYAEIHGINKS